MYCQACGLEATAGLNYCKRCGAAIGRTPSAQAPPRPPGGLSALFLIATCALSMFALGIPWVGANQLREIGVTTGPIAAMFIVSLIAGFGAISLFGMGFFKLLGLYRPSSSVEVPRPQAEMPLNQARLPLGPASESIPSVTEHTTRSFDRKVEKEFG